MTNEELNRRTAFCANEGFPYSDRLWLLLSYAWRHGCIAGNEGANGFDDNPFREGALDNGEELSTRIRSVQP